MPELYFPAPGVGIDRAALTVPKAQQLAGFLATGAHPWARLIETYFSAGSDPAETVVLDVDVEVGQEPIHDIRPVERLAVTFRASDRYWPEVLALRLDFPRNVPHLFPSLENVACSLCLYEESYDELRLGWTAPKIVERIRFWLRETSRGTLHAPDQPLEPLFAGRFDSLILLPTLLPADGTQPVSFSVNSYDYGVSATVYVSTRMEPAVTRSGGGFIATVFCAQPSVHGAIRFPPHNLFELDSVTCSTGLDLLDGLRKRIGEWKHDRSILQSRLILVIVFPKIRAAGLPVEVSDIWAFATGATVSKIGEALALWQVDSQGFLGQLVGTSLERARSSTIAVTPVIPRFALTRAGAAAANGVSPDTRRIVAIGVGALGSQIVGNLARSGYGHWQFIDKDVFLPHNAARHELPHAMVGWNKARAMTEWANTLLAEPVADEGIVADVLHPGDQADALRNAFQKADVIADFSASQAVARYLARDVKGGARRVSAFLNPNGSDVVVLAEDVQWQVPIDCVEMQYYRALLEHPELGNHFAATVRRIRTARSCGDVSTILPGDAVSHHAAVASRGIRGALAQGDASIAIWTTDTEQNTRAVRVQAAPVVEVEINGWHLVTDTGFIEQVRALRKARLPQETGGILLGSWDLQRYIVYVVATIPSPVDSEECPSSYIRGCEGLEIEVRKARALTDSQLQYLGEWHSHPDRYSIDPSEDDHELFAWLHNYMSQDGYPAVMLIVGKEELRWFIGSL